VLLMLGFVGAGCQTSHPAPSNRMAWITITNRTLAEVENVTREAFTKHSYQGGRTEPGRFTFEKPGTSWDQFTYGGWIDPNVWKRVLVTVRQADGQTVVVDCDAYVVRFHGDYRFEEVQKLGKRHRGPYQALLDEIHDRFKGLPVDD